MGMFDTVRFRYRMPDGVTGTDFQTDDLDCECEFYEISAEGRLLRWMGDGTRNIAILPPSLFINLSCGYHSSGTKILVCNWGMPIYISTSSEKSLYPHPVC